jgi:hypothetical protein
MGSAIGHLRPLAAEHGVVAEQAVDHVSQE